MIIFYHLIPYIDSHYLRSYTFSYVSIGVFDQKVETLLNPFVKYLKYEHYDFNMELEFCPSKMSYTSQEWIMVITY